jgi:antitoxin PrlF
MTPRITAKGQVTIPKRILDYLGVAPGSEMDFTLAADGRVFLKAADRKEIDRPPQDRFACLRGSANSA